MTTASETQRLAYVDRVIRTVFGVRASRVSRKLSPPTWLIDQSTAATRTLVRFLARLGACRQVASSFNRLLMPSRWILDDHHAVFALENQGACRWGINLKSSRQVVFQQPAGSTEWFQEPSELLPFLVTFCFWNAVNGGLKHCVVVEASPSLRDISNRFVPVKSSLGRFDQNTRLYYSDGAAVFCTKELTEWRVNGGFRSAKRAAEFKSQFASED